MKTKVTINRKDTFFNLFRDYKILVNNQEIGKLSNNTTFNFEIDQPSEIQLKIDWCSSNVLTLEPNGKTLEISSSCNLKGWKTVMFPLYLTMFSKEYLLLENRTYES